MNHKTPGEVLIDFQRRWLQRWGSDNRLQESPVYLAACATADITWPYHSLSYLAGALNKSGHPYVVRDIGIEFWHYVISPGVISELERECRRRLDTTTGSDKDLFRLFTDLCHNAESFSSAFDDLRNPESFYRLDSYIRSANRLTLLPWIVTLLSEESIYRTFNSAEPPGYMQGSLDLEKLKSSISNGTGVDVFDFYYEYHAREIVKCAPGFVGITVTSLSQLEHSLILGRKLKNLNCTVTMGGPVIAKIYKYVNRVEDLKILSCSADYWAIGEADTLISGLAEAGGSVSEIERLPNLIKLSSPKKLSSIHFEEMDALACPDYSLWDYSLYASPKPGLIYSPARGCYWNKCAFCDLGLSVDRPTSPWRARSPDLVIDDLVEASKFGKYFCFSADVLSPGYIVELSRKIIEYDLNIKWMADLRLESAFTKKNARVLRQAGCLSISLGMESSEQAVLDMMNKGTRANRLPTIVDAFNTAGIAVDLMAFVGFPGETRRQAKTTLRSAEELSKKVATMAVRKFALTPGSLVARHEEAYGVEIIRDASSKNMVPFYPRWRWLNQREDYSLEMMNKSQHFLRGFSYPFVGAVTAFHSLLYYEGQEKHEHVVPARGYKIMHGKPFFVIPCYFRGRSHNGFQSTLMSSIDGKLHWLSRELADAVDDMFGGGDWALIENSSEMPVSLREFLDFLEEHALAVFLAK